MDTDINISNVEKASLNAEEVVSRLKDKSITVDTTANVNELGHAELVELENQVQDAIDKLNAALNIKDTKMSAMDDVI